MLVYCYVRKTQILFSARAPSELVAHSFLFQQPGPFPFRFCHVLFCSVGSPFLFPPFSSGCSTQNSALVPPPSPYSACSWRR